MQSVLQYEKGYVSINVWLLKTLPTTLPITLSKNVISVTLVIST